MKLEIISGKKGSSPIKIDTSNMDNCKDIQDMNIGAGTKEISGTLKGGHQKSLLRDIRSFCQEEGWSGGAMVLGKLPVPGRPTIWMIVGQGSIPFAVGADGVVWTFFLSTIFSFLFLPLYGRRPDID